MVIIDHAILRRFHQQRINEFGTGTAQALGWRGNANQLVRFSMLQGIGDMNGCSVLDAGCGYGDLRGYLHPIYPLLRYAGIDMIEEFITLAVERYAYLPETGFYLGDFLEAPLPCMDYVLASGSLSYRSSKPNFIYTAITKLFYSSRVAFGFNLLSQVDLPNSLLAAYNPTDILKHCRTLTSKVVLQEGYFEADYTVWMYW